MKASKPVVTIGDAIIDAVETLDVPPVLYPGGAALNLAVGLARLGLPSLLAARIGLDRNGFRLARYLREEGVRLVNTPNADFTGVATSRRRDGEPSYDFAPSMYRRRIAFDAALLGAVAEAPAIAVNSFSYADAWQVEALCDALARRARVEILRSQSAPEVDPRSSRPSGKASNEHWRRATLIKLSDEDARFLYGARRRWTCSVADWNAASRSCSSRAENLAPAYLRAPGSAYLFQLHRSRRRSSTRWERGMLRSLA